MGGGIDIQGRIALRISATAARILFPAARTALVPPGAAFGKAPLSPPASGSRCRQLLLMLRASIGHT